MARIIHNVYVSFLRQCIDQILPIAGMGYPVIQRSGPNLYRNGYLSQPLLIKGKTAMLIALMRESDANGVSLLRKELAAISSIIPT